MSKTTKLDKPVDKIEFWKERIKTAQKDQYTVYVCNDVLWKELNQAHKLIIEKEVQGSVLDAGCGYGRLSELFTDYRGVDFSPDFIEMAKTRYPEKADTFQVADLKKLPFEKKSIDWSICVSIKKMVIDNLGEDEWNLIQKELERVCKNILILEYETPWNYTIVNSGEHHKEYDR